MLFQVLALYLSGIFALFHTLAAKIDILVYCQLNYEMHFSLICGS